MLKQFKMKVCLSTISTIFVAHFQTAWAAETASIEELPKHQLRHSSIPYESARPSFDKMDSHQLSSFLNEIQKLRRDSSAQILRASAVTQTEWIKQLTANIDARAGELRELSEQIDTLSKQLKEAQRNKASVSSKNEKNRAKKARRWTRKEEKLTADMQEPLKKLVYLQSLQTFEGHLRCKADDLRSYDRLSDFFGNSMLGKILKVPALLGASFLMPAFNGTPSPEKMRSVRTGDNGNLVLGEDRNYAQTVDNFISLFLTAGTIAYNNGWAQNPYLFATLAFGGLYREADMVKNCAYQLMRGLVGKSLSSEKIEFLSYGAFALYNLLYLPGVAGFPYAPFTSTPEVELSGFATASLAASGNTIFASIPNATLGNVTGTYYTSSLVPNSETFTISLSPMAWPTYPASAILSDGVTTISAYGITTNGGDVAFRAGNRTAGFTGPEITLSPTVGQQLRPSLVPLPNNKFSIFVQTSPGGIHASSIGYTYDMSSGSPVLLTGPYGTSQFASASSDQTLPSAALFGNGQIGVTFQNSQPGANRVQSAVVLDPLSGANVVPDYPLKTPSGAISQGAGECTSLQSGDLGCVLEESSGLWSVVVNSSGASVGPVSQVNSPTNNQIGSLDPFYATVTPDGNWVVTYTALALPTIPGPARANYAVLDPNGALLASDINFAQNAYNNGQAGGPVVALPGSDVVAGFLGSNSQGASGAFARVLTNLGSRTSAPISSPPSASTSLPTPGPTLSTTPGVPTSLSPSGVVSTLSPSSRAPTLSSTPIHASAANSLQPPLTSIIKGMSGALNWGFEAVRRTLGR